jgi:hypothetical protein
MSDKTDLSREKAETDEPVVEPIAHPIRTAFKMLGISPVKGYDVVGAGELNTYTVGRRRYASLSAINDFIARREAADRGSRAKVAA